MEGLPMKSEVEEEFPPPPPIIPIIPLPPPPPPMIPAKREMNEFKRASTGETPEPVELPPEEAAAPDELPPSALLARSTTVEMIADPPTLGSGVLRPLPDVASLLT